MLSILQEQPSRRYKIVNLVITNFIHTWHI